MDRLPTEIYMQIFEDFTIEELYLSRIVCLRWKDVIDGILDNENLWKKECYKNFPEVIEVARRNARPDLLWRNTYRSLKLWSRLETAQEFTDEFALATIPEEEIQNLQIVENGITGVHNQDGIRYYDITTTEILREPIIPGDYYKYMENEYATLFMCCSMHLIVLRKVRPLTHVTYEDVKMFTSKDNHVYFLNMEDDLIYIDLKDDDLTCCFIDNISTVIVAFGFNDYTLNILTSEKTIYSVINQQLVLKSDLEAVPNMADELHKYNFLEYLDWRIYFEWSEQMNRPIPKGIMRDMITIRTYGDVFLVGTNMGVLRIFYKPFINNQLDLFNSQPIQQYNFMESEDCPVLGTSPIIQIDVMEIEEGHIVVVGMPNKVATIAFHHVFD